MQSICLIIFSLNGVIYATPTRRENPRAERSGKYVKYHIQVYFFSSSNSIMIYESSLYGVCVSCFPASSDVNFIDIAFNSKTLRVCSLSYIDFELTHGFSGIEKIIDGPKICLNSAHNIISELSVIC